jgi:hypothetical protein
LNFCLPGWPLPQAERTRTSRRRDKMQQHKPPRAALVLLLVFQAAFFVVLARVKFFPPSAVVAPPQCGPNVAVPAGAANPSSTPAQECPRLDPAWHNRILEALALVRPVSDSKLLDDLGRHENRGTLLRVVKNSRGSFVAFDGQGHFGVRGLSARVQFARLLDKFPNLRHFDVMLNTYDWPLCFRGFRKPSDRDLGPVFSYSVVLHRGNYSRFHGCRDIPIPDFTWHGWCVSARVCAH